MQVAVRGTKILVIRGDELFPDLFQGVMPVLGSPPELLKSLPAPHGTEKRELAEVIHEAEEAVCPILVW